MCVCVCVCVSFCFSSVSASICLSDCLSLSLPLRPCLPTSLSPSLSLLMFWLMAFYEFMCVCAPAQAYVFILLGWCGTFLVSIAYRLVLLYICRFKRCFGLFIFPISVHSTDGSSGRRAHYHLSSNDNFYYYITAIIVCMY